MFKKTLIILLALIMVLSFSACKDDDVAGSDAFNNFNEAIDLDFAKSVIETISSFGDDPVMGMRSAGSPAETETAHYVKGVMEEIGLENVTMDEITLDGWTFKGANITFTNADGQEQRVDLGGYQTTIVADNEELDLVFVNEGTEADYQGLDVKGKLVMIDIDQNENWWISQPAYQAKVMGAKAVIAMSIYPEDGLDRVGVQDICGPADAPALAISEQDRDAVLEAIEASGGNSIKVVLNADSRVTNNATSHNVWGEIPGKTPETIFVFAHMDGYFHSSYDDAQGVGTSLAIAKALIDSGFEPERTIRFCMHGAEEWGISGTEYDWSIGAFLELAEVHPEWVEGAFVIVNNDGGYCVEGEEYFGVRTAVELMDFVEESAGPLWDDSDYEWSIDKTSTYTEDFYWAIKGIPAIVAGEGEGGNYDDTGYHSNYDSWDAQPLDESALRETIALYGKFVLDLDDRLVMPMNFTARLEDFEDSLADDSMFADLLESAYEAATAIEEKMATIEDSGDRDAAIEFNKQLQEIYIAFQDAFLGLDFEPEAITRHELYQNNVEALQDTIEALEAGDLQEAYDDILPDLDWAWYHMFFDKKTNAYLEKQLFENAEGTWGQGLVRYPMCDIGDVVRSLAVKYDIENADVSLELAELGRLLDIELDKLDQTYKEEKTGLEKIVKLMENYAK